MNTEEFFDAVYDCRLSDLDTYNKIKEMTNNFEPKLLNMLCDDFDFYFFMKDEEMLALVKHEEIVEKIHEYEENGREIPKLSDTNRPKSVSHFFKSTKGKNFKIIDEEKYKEGTKKFLEENKSILENAVDVEKLMYPTRFYCLYKLRNLLVELKRQHTSAEYKYNIPGSSFNPFTRNLSSDKSETVKFFESVNSGEILKLDIHNRIQELTDNYDEDKLNLLCEEFDSYIFVKYENWRDSYSLEDIEKKITEYHEKGIKLPIKGDEQKRYHWLYVRDFFLHERFGKPIPDEEFEKQMNEIFSHDRNKHDVIDDNVLLGGFYYATDSKYLKDLRDILVKLKSKHTSSVYRFNDKPEKLQAENNYIKWYNSDDDSLEQFIEALIEQNLIEEREPETIIKDHFKPVREQNREAEPIVWLDNQNLLVYLFTKLYKKYFINPKGKKWQLVSEHFIKSNGDQFKDRSLAVEANKQKDGSLPANGTNTVDKIIDRLITD